MSGTGINESNVVFVVDQYWADLSARVAAMPEADRGLAEPLLEDLAREIDVTKRAWRGATIAAHAARQTRARAEEAYAHAHSDAMGCQAVEFDDFQYWGQVAIEEGFFADTIMCHGYGVARMAEPPAEIYALFHQGHFLKEGKTLAPFVFDAPGFGASFEGEWSVDPWSGELVSACGMARFANGSFGGGILDTTQRTSFRHNIIYNTVDETLAAGQVNADFTDDGSDDMGVISMAAFGDELSGLALKIRLGREIVAGEWADDTLNGRGLICQDGGGYQLGTFRNGRLV